MDFPHCLIPVRVTTGNFDVKNVSFSFIFLSIIIAVSLGLWGEDTSFSSNYYKICIDNHAKTVVNYKIYIKYYAILVVDYRIYIKNRWQ